MTKNINFNLPAYRHAESTLFTKVILGFQGLDPLLGSMPSTITHHYGPIRYMHDTKVLDQYDEAIQHTIRLDNESIRTTDIEALTEELSKLAEAFRASVAKLFFKQTGEILDTVGNTVDAEARPFSFDLFNEALEKIHLEFDEKGEPIMPTLVTHPDMIKVIQTMKPTEEQIKRSKEIISHQKAAFYARKRTRRLPR